MYFVTYVRATQCHHRVVYFIDFKEVISYEYNLYCFFYTARTLLIKQHTENEI